MSCLLARPEPVDTQVAQLHFRRLRVNTVRGCNPLLYIMVCPSGRRRSLLLSVMLSRRKPLGEPAPQVTNLALAVVLLIVLGVQTGFNAWQDYSTGQTMRSIANMLPADVTVLRDGSKATVPAAELVTGDVVYVSLGNKLPADLRLIEVSQDFKVDRAVLTGESEPINGAVDYTDTNFLETKNIALQGTLCVGGTAVGIVVQAGDNTVLYVLRPSSISTLS